MTRADSGHSSDLLRFARDVYAEPGIQAICLYLQDEYDIDVVLLLTCCWFGCYHGELSDAQFAQATGFSGQWRAQLVQPLRQARRWLKPHPADHAGIPAEDQEALRQRIKALELDAEFMQLRALAALFAGPQTAPDTSDAEAAASIRINLGRYCGHGPVPGNTRQAVLAEADLAALVRASIRCR